MVLAYVANVKDEQPTVDGFLNWNPNNTYHVVRQLVFTYALAVMVNKLGDRNNNENIQTAGRYKFMELFYAFNHPIYQEIEYRDLRQKVIMPDEVRKQREENLTYTISKAPKKHQGGDFILEGKVRRQKMLASKGSDTQKMWREIARSLDDIEEVSKKLNEVLNLHDNENHRNTNLSLEILRWRALLRHDGYLLKNNCKNLAYSMYGEPLSVDIINLSENAKEKMSSYFQIMEEKGRVHKGEISWLQVLPNEEVDELLFEFEGGENAEELEE